VNRWPTGREAMCAVVYVHVEEGGRGSVRRRAGRRRIGLPGLRGLVLWEGELEYKPGD